MVKKNIVEKKVSFLSLKGIKIACMYHSFLSRTFLPSTAIKKYYYH